MALRDALTVRMDHVCTPGKSPVDIHTGGVPPGYHPQQWTQEPVACFVSFYFEAGLIGS